jgi:glycosyltransferase involved in cell wall biosynthesis
MNVLSKKIKKVNNLRIIISPSGNLYGSENVLFDYLKNSSLNISKIFVPANSLFVAKLTESGFKTLTFSNVKMLYFKIVLFLFFNKCKSVYCNEAGHIKYMSILAALFPKVKFIIHVRILEDSDRIKKSQNNLILISISETIQKRMSIKGKLIYDGYDFGNLEGWKTPISNKLKVGIVGRVTKTKGIEIFTNIFNELCGSNIEFHFFGDIDQDFSCTETFDNLKKSTNIFFHGFVNDKNLIYKKIDLLLHLNKDEPLGRIFFESLDFGIPFVGIKSGGISEISDIIEYPYTYPIEEISNILIRISYQEMEFDFLKLEYSRNRAIDFFSISKYSIELDNIIA